MDFPLDYYYEVENEEIYGRFFGNLNVKKVIRGKTTKKTVLIVEDDTELRDMTPNFAQMKICQESFSYGIGISKKGFQYDIESRYFNPWSGVDEDQVTGSIHTLLG